MTYRERRESIGKARLMIRAKVYRGTAGFSIYGHDSYERSIRIFTLTLASARRIKARKIAGEEIVATDWGLA